MKNDRRYGLGLWILIVLSLMVGLMRRPPVAAQEIRPTPTNVGEEPRSTPVPPTAVPDPEETSAPSGSVASNQPAAQPTPTPTEVVEEIKMLPQTGFLNLREWPIGLVALVFVGLVVGARYLRTRNRH